MKVLFVQVHSGIGGATTSMFQLIRELKSRGFKPEVLITGGEGPLVDWLRKEGIPVRLEKNLLSYGHGNGARTEFWSIPPFRPITDLFKLRKSVKHYQKIFSEVNPDLVYLNSSILWPAAMAASRAGIHVVTHVREVWYHGLFGIRKRFFIRLTERLSDHIFVLSHFSRSQFSAETHNKITVAYNAVDFERYDKVMGKKASEMKAKVGLNPNKHVVIMLGGALPHKGGAVFLKAASQILNKRIDVQFVVLGRVEPYYPEGNKSIKGRIRKLLVKDPGLYFQQLAEKLALSNSLVLPGLVTNVPEWLKVSDVLVFPATTDHFGRPIIEAGYMQVPVLASDTDTSAELVNDGQNGLLFKVNSPRDLSSKLAVLLGSGELRKRMGQEGKKLALERYSLEKQLDIIVHVLNVTLSEAD